MEYDYIFHEYMHLKAVEPFIQLCGGQGTEF